MKLLDKYLVRTFLILFVYSMIAFLAIFLVIDVVENVDRFIDAGLNRQQILTYYALNVPFFLSTALPMSMLISSIFSIGTLAKNNELTAMKSSGISLYRITFPLLLLAIVISVVSFFFDDQITVHTNRQLEEYKDQYIHKRPPQRQLIRNNIFIQDTPDRNLIIQQFDGEEKSGNQASIQYLGEDRIVKRIDAGTIFYSDSLNQWFLSEYVIREFTDQDTQSVTTGSNDTMLVHLNVNPEDILKESVDPAQMDYAELTDFIDKLKRLGIDPRKWIVNLHFKWAFAFTNFVVVLFGLPLVANQKKGGLAFGTGVAIFIIFTYYAFIKVGQVMGFNGILPPFLSVWLGNIIFITAGLILLMNTQK